MSLTRSPGTDPGQEPPAATARPAWLSWLGGNFLNAPRWLWLAFLGVSLVLVLFPQIDLTVSSLFYTPGVGFTTRGTWFERLVHQSTYWLLILGVPALVAVWWVHGRIGRLGRADRPKPSSSNFGRHPDQDSNIGTGTGGGPRPGRRVLIGRELAYLLLVLALGPGLIVNGILKEYWGRARPMNCVDFGGTQVFTPAFMPSDQGGKSFSSGHASGSAYWVVVVLVLAWGPWRRYWLGLALGYSLLVAWARLAAGGHFLSDILVSWFILALLAWGLYSRFHPLPPVTLGPGHPPRRPEPDCPLTSTRSPTPRARY